MSDPSQAIRDWLAIHRELLAFETAFTDLAMKAARGELPMGELDQQRGRLMSLRQQCTQAYERAFSRTGDAAAC